MDKQVASARNRRIKLRSSAKPMLTAELFTVPLEDEEYLIYAPLRQAAFVVSARVVNFLADLQVGKYDRDLDPDLTVRSFEKR